MEPQLFAIPRNRYEDDRDVTAQLVIRKKSSSMGMEEATLDLFDARYQAIPRFNISVLISGGLWCMVEIYRRAEF